MSQEGLEEVRNLETPELCLRRAAAKDATPEDIVSWNVEEDRTAKEISGKIQDAVEKEHANDDRKMSDDGMDGLEGLLVLMKVQA